MSHEDALATLILLISSYWNERSIFYDTFYYITFKLDLMQFTKKDGKYINLPCIRIKE